nr:putative RNA-directed DNA polymerase, eukaryota, reverse transcriptase zinc-binding domain protein [Tanacetum cinerariifolium]
QLIDRGMFAPIFVGKDNLVPISHLLYADDAMFIEKWSCENVNVLMMMLQWFFLASGLKVNLHKNSLYGVGVRPSEVPKGVLSHLESLRNSFFFREDMEERKITWVCWLKVRANKHLGGLRISMAMMELLITPFRLVMATRYGKWFLMLPPDSNLMMLT